MKIAVFSDIHANIYAFRAALADARQQGVGGYFFLGDMITDLPWANEVYDIIRGLNHVKIIRGNRERIILELDRQGEHRNYRQLASICWTYDVLSAENKAYISALPDELTFELRGTRFHLNHRPEDIWGKRTADGLHHFTKPNENHCDYVNIMKAAVQNNPDVSSMPHGIYLYGHHHGQWHWRLGGTVIMAPGSCGLAADNETRAEYSILTYQGGRWDVQERLIEYDRHTMLRDFRSSALYAASPIWSEATALTIETGWENLHLLFKHLDDVCGQRGVRYKFCPNDIWETEGRKWLDEYKNLIT